MNQQVILLEDGWNRLKTGGVQKIEEILEDMQGGVYKTKISTDEYSNLYTCAAPRVARPAMPSPRACSHSTAVSLQQPTQSLPSKPSLPSLTRLSLGPQHRVHDVHPEAP